MRPRVGYLAIEVNSLKDLVVICHTKDSFDKFVKESPRAGLGNPERYGEVTFMTRDDYKVGKELLLKEGYTIEEIRHRCRPYCVFV